MRYHGHKMQDFVYIAFPDKRIIGEFSRRRKEVEQNSPNTLPRALAREIKRIYRVVKDEIKSSGFSNDSRL
jgi:hypothetical protein